MTISPRVLAKMALVLSVLMGSVALAGAAGAVAMQTVVTSFSVSGTATSVTANWTVSSASFQSFTCTLLYGYSNASGFSQTTTAPSCTFSGLKGGSSYGVELVVNYGEGSTQPLFAMASTLATNGSSNSGVHHRTAHKTAIRCVAGKKFKWVAAVHPVCPPGYHRP